MNHPETFDKFVVPVHLSKCVNVQTAGLRAWGTLLPKPNIYYMALH